MEGIDKRGGWVVVVEKKWWEGGSGGGFKENYGKNELANAVFIFL